MINHHHKDEQEQAGVRQQYQDGAEENENQVDARTTTTTPAGDDASLTTRRTASSPTSTAAVVVVQRCPSTDAPENTTTSQDSSRGEGAGGRLSPTTFLMSDVAVSQGHLVAPPRGRQEPPPTQGSYNLPRCTNYHYHQHVRGSFPHPLRNPLPPELFYFSSPPFLLSRCEDEDDHHHTRHQCSCDDRIDTEMTSPHQAARDHCDHPAHDHRHQDDSSTKNNKEDDEEQEGEKETSDEDGTTSRRRFSHVLRIIEAALQIHYSSGHEEQDKEEDAP